MSTRRSVPWDRKGFLEAFERWQVVLAAPPEERAANSMAAYFVERYGRTRGLAHFARWLKIGDFLARHITRLHREGLVWVGPNSVLEMRADLITALCRVPLRGRRLVLADVEAHLRRRRRRGRRRVDR